MDKMLKIHYFRKIRIKFENGISVEIISESKKDGSPPEKLIKIHEENEFKDFFKFLKENYGVKEIEGEIEKEENVDKTHALSIVLYPESEKEKENETLKIFDKSSIRLTEIGSYDIIAKQGKEELEIFLSEEEITKNFVNYFGGRKNQCIINFKGHTFFGNIIIKEKEISSRIPILVYPVKLEPKDAEKILNELLIEQEEIIKPSPTGIFLQPGEELIKTPLQTLILINYLFSEKRKNGIPLGKTLRAIANSPDKVIIKEKIKREIYKITNINEEAIFEAIISGNIKKSNHNYHFLWNNKKYSFTSLLNQEAKISYNTYSNRFIKYFLEFLRNTINICCEIIHKNYEKINGGFVENLIKRVQFYKIKYIMPTLNLEWMKEVSKITHLSSPPQKLLKDPFYSSAFFDYLILIKNLKLANEEFEKYLRNPITYIPELYEMWCGLKLKRIAKEMEAEFEYQSFYEQKTDEENWYSYSIPLRPDFSIIKDEKLILFDAKYRKEFIEKLEEEKMNELKSEEKRGTFKLGDLYKMHTYREAIRKGNEKTLWVIALYPGNEIALFSENGENIIKEFKEEKYEEIKKEIEEKMKDLKYGGIGAIPFYPELFENEEKQKFLYFIFKKIFLC